MVAFHQNRATYVSSYQRCLVINPGYAEYTTFIARRKYVLLQTCITFVVWWFNLEKCLINPFCDNLVAVEINSFIFCFPNAFLHRHNPSAFPRTNKMPAFFILLLLSLAWQFINDVEVISRFFPLALQWLPKQSYFLLNAHRNSALCWVPHLKHFCAANMMFQSPCRSGMSSQSITNLIASWKLMLFLINVIFRNNFWTNIASSRPNVFFRFFSDVIATSCEREWF